MFQSKKSKALLTQICDGDPTPAMLLSVQEKSFNIFSDTTKNVKENAEPSFIGTLFTLCVFMPACILGSILYFGFEYTFWETAVIVYDVLSVLFIVVFSLIACLLVVGILYWVVTFLIWIYKFLRGTLRITVRLYKKLFHK